MNYAREQKSDYNYMYNTHPRDDYKRKYNYWDDEEEEEEDITFYRPNGTTETKSKSWCRDNDFFCVEDDLWSGEWYWEHFPEKKREIEERKEKKRKRSIEDRKRSTEDLLARTKRERRAELLDLACDYEEGCYESERARGELRKMDEAEWEFLCPVGCGRRFPNGDDLQLHLMTQTGKGHTRYRQENNISFSSLEEMEKVPASEREERAKESARTNDLIREEFSRNHKKLPAADQCHFQLDLEEVLHKSIDERKTWLDTVAAARKRHQVSCQRDFMKNWLRSG